MKYRLIAAEKEQIPAHLRPSLDLSGPHSQFRQPLRCMRSGTCCTMTAFLGARVPRWHIPLRVVFDLAAALSWSCSSSIGSDRMAPQFVASEPHNIAWSP